MIRRHKTNNGTDGVIVCNDSSKCLCWKGKSVEIGHSSAIVRSSKYRSSCKFFKAKRRQTLYERIPVAHNPTKTALPNVRLNTFCLDGIQLCIHSNSGFKSIFLFHKSKPISGFDIFHKLASMAASTKNISETAMQGVGSFAFSNNSRHLSRQIVYMLHRRVGSGCLMHFTWSAPPPMTSMTGCNQTTA